ncbi:formylglycine-generating enzyme family protein [bacterium]|nr:formylglycine-generating enzyme family protein [bacterium]
MSFKYRSHWLIGLALGSLLLAVTGCSGDDDPVDPVHQDRGTIVIDQTPDTLDGSGWSLAGAAARSGEGDLTLADMPTGEYTLTWQEVSGYESPAVATGTLATGGTLRFAGTYVEDPTLPEGFVPIPAGTFTMGTPLDDPGREIEEVPHLVTLTTPFLMQATEVTNRQFADLAQWALDQGHCNVTEEGIVDALDGSIQILMGLGLENSEIAFAAGRFTVGPGKEDYPVQRVTWYTAATYCDWLSLREDLPRAYDHTDWRCNDNDPYHATGYRLPTEAEWEYACRAGSETPFNTGECLDAGTEANYSGNFPIAECPVGPFVGWTVPVETFPPNAWGLFEMHGNLSEWCNDGYEPYGGDVTDPTGPSDPGDFRARRGGRWVSHAADCRSAFRDFIGPGFIDIFTGFRPVRSTD